VQLLQCGIWIERLIIFVLPFFCPGVSVGVGDADDSCEVRAGKSTDIRLIRRQGRSCAGSGYLTGSGATLEFTPAPANEMAIPVDGSLKVL
jgi:hypothetical protein